MVKPCTSDHARAMAAAWSSDNASSAAPEIFSWRPAPTPLASPAKEAVAASEAYPDPKLGDPKRPVVDLTPDRRLRQPVTLAQAKADATLKTTPLARQPRLSVMPLSETEFKRVLKLAGE